jgi:hypothetical protein
MTLHGNELIPSTRRQIVDQEEREIRLASGRTEQSEFRRGEGVRCASTEIYHNFELFIGYKQFIIAVTGYGCFGPKGDCRKLAMEEAH